MVIQVLKKKLPYKDSFTGKDKVRGFLVYDVIEAVEDYMINIVFMNKDIDVIDHLDNFSYSFYTELVYLENYKDLMDWLRHL